MNMLTEMEKRALEKARSIKEEESENVDFAAEGNSAIEIPTDGGGNLVKQNITKGALSDEDVAQFARMAAPVSTEVEVPVQEAKEEPEVTEEKVKEAEENDTPDRCPRCGCEVDATGIPEVTDEDKKEYIKSLLGERRFYKTYEFIGGEVKITLRSTMIEEEADIVKLITKEINDKIISTPEEWSLSRDSIRLAYIVAKVEVSSTEVELPEVARPDGITVDELYKAVQDKIAVRNKWPTALAGMFSFAMTSFDELYTTLTARTYDADFWTGLAGSKV